METPRAFFVDERESDVDKLVVVESDDDSVRVAWYRDGEWRTPFWMPEGEFRAQVHGDAVERRGLLPDDKFERVVEAAKA